FIVIETGWNVWLKNIKQKTLGAIVADLILLVLVLFLYYFILGSVIYFFFNVLLPMHLSN
ncbi:MAG: hypothetical protein PHG97_06955, partial [Candidatus Margulisbacteria bacterium]|nr:hypothetical protein [Candidatus Margulisiibacteriota bacterium]